MTVIGMPHVPINPAIEEPEAGGSLAPIGSRPVWATQWDSISKCKIKYVGRWFGPNACPRSRRADQTKVIHVRLQGTRWKPSFLIQLLRNECQIPKQPFVAGMVVSKSSVTKPLQEKWILKKPASFCSQLLLLLLLHSAFSCLGSSPSLLRSPARSFWFWEKGMPNSGTGKDRKTEKLNSLWRSVVETITESLWLIHSRSAFRQ